MSSLNQYTLPKVKSLQKSPNVCNDCLKFPHGGSSCNVAAWARMSESVLRVNCVHPREVAIDAARSTASPSACKGERHGVLSDHDNTIPRLLVATPATHASEAVHAASVGMVGPSSSCPELCPYFMVLGGLPPLSRLCWCSV